MIVTPFASVHDTGGRPRSERAPSRKFMRDATHLFAESVRRREGAGVLLRRGGWKAEVLEVSKGERVSCYELRITADAARLSWSVMLEDGNDVLNEAMLRDAARIGEDMGSGLIPVCSRREPSKLWRFLRSVFERAAKVGGASW